MGYNQVGDAKPPYDELIERANDSQVPIIAFDNPSGFDIEIGRPTKFTIKAAVTVTLAAVKKGLMERSAEDFVGKLYLVDLGIPKEAYQKVGLEYPFVRPQEGVIL